jgi:hypothetical protein
MSDLLDFTEQERLPTEDELRWSRAAAWGHGQSLGPWAHGVPENECRRIEELRDWQRKHSERFRQVSARYPRRVAEAYGRNLNRAAADTDAQVAATVAAWESAQGLDPIDWHAVGREERDEDAEEPDR